MSQRRFIYGIVRDSATKEEMIGTHVRNLSSDKLAISDAYGKFRMPVQSGDSLVLSNVGYQMLLWIANDSWFDQERVAFFLPADTVYLEEVIVNEFPEYGRFKQIIVNTKPLDSSFWYHGVPKPHMKEHTVLEKKDYTNPLFMAGHPITFWHYAFSKKEKEKRKMQQIQKQRGVTDIAYKKFNREWVGEVTSLEGDQLTHFMAYCQFTPEYLAETPLYIIQERMLAILEDFLDEGAEG